MEIQCVMHHIQLKKGNVGRCVLLPGDPGCCASIDSYFFHAEKVAQSREYTSYTGEFQGVMVSVVSTGIGCRSAAIAVEELAAIGADTFIRVGTCGTMQQFIQVGDLVVTSAAVRDEGTTRQYMPIEFPAVANLDGPWPYGKPPNAWACGTTWGSPRARIHFTVSVSLNACRYLNS
jgi:uridine phosphorylase